jgi:hypothetical protein
MVSKVGRFSLQKHMKYATVAKIISDKLHFAESLLRYTSSSNDISRATSTIHKRKTSPSNFISQIAPNRIPPLQYFHSIPKLECLDLPNQKLELQALRSKHGPNYALGTPNSNIVLSCYVVTIPVHSSRHVCLQRRQLDTICNIVPLNLKYFYTVFNEWQPFYKCVGTETRNLYRIDFLFIQP